MAVAAADLTAQVVTALDAQAAQTKLETAANTAIAAADLTDQVVTALDVQAAQTKLETAANRGDRGRRR